MRTDLEMFEMYKDEKAMVIGNFNERTGLESFPTFKSWKEDYIKDYLDTHIEVSLKEADRLMDAAVEAAEEELEIMLKEGASKAEIKEAGIRVEAAKAKKAERQPKKAKQKSPGKRMSGKRASNKVVTKAKGTGQKRSVNKAAGARAIFAEMYPKVEAGELARKDIIAKFLEVGMTKAGASTYYQKNKSSWNQL